MNATIEREASPVFSKCRHVRAVRLEEPTNRYKAPLATFMALVASARASAAALDDAVQEPVNLAGGIRA